MSYLYNIILRKLFVHSITSRSRASKTRTNFWLYFLMTIFRNFPKMLHFSFKFLDDLLFSHYFLWIENELVWFQMKSRRFSLTHNFFLKNFSSAKGKKL